MKATIPIRRRHPAAAGAVLLALLFASAAPANAQEATFHACYVPNVGAVYLIKVTGLPENCLSTSHVEISWTDGSAEALPDGSIVTAKIADGAVTTPKLADGVVTTPNLLDGAVTAPKLVDGAVTTSKLGDEAVTAPKLADGAVTATKLAGVIKRRSTLVDVANGATGTAEVVCEPGEVFLGGGGGFLGGEMDAAVTFAGDVNGIWKVHGVNKAGGIRQLEAQVHCLAAG